MRVLVTRPEPDASKTAERLRALGHEAVVAPLMAIVEDRTVPIDPSGLASIAVTSANAVAALAARADFAVLRSIPLFAVGDVTAEAARAAGFASVRSAAGAADDLARLILAESRRADGPRHGRILYAAGRDRTGDLDGTLRRAGLAVDILEVYRAEPAPLGPDTVAMLEAGGIDATLVYSRRSADLLLGVLPKPLLDRLAETLAVHVISEAAAAPLRAAGFRRIVVAERPNADGLLATLG